ncbi:MAG: phage tail protein [Eubacterium sp.]|nr:phage tail protein [Eubacterium sp.]
MSRKTYTTISGDMWDQIAYAQMGSVLYMDKLIKANADYAAMFVFPAGVALTIPEVEEKRSMELPPWKRGLLI